MPNAESARPQNSQCEALTLEEKTAVASMQAMFASNYELDASEVQMGIDKYPNGILIGDLWGYITYVNQPLVRMMGSSNTGEFVGKHILNFLPKEVRAQVTAKSLNCIANNVTQQGHYSVRSVNGEALSFEAIMDFLRDKKGENIGFIDIIRKLPK
jgi:PAS domain S-box-containing protein